MEVAAGFTEHVDHRPDGCSTRSIRSARREHPGLLHLGRQWLVGEGQLGTISELLAQNGIPSRVDHIAALDAMGGLDAAWIAEDRQPVPRRLGLGGQLALQRHETAGLSPRRHAQPDGHPLAGQIKPDATPRTQFHHCNDIVPTIYEIVGIAPPRVVNGIPQDTIDGVSLAYSLNDPGARPAAHPVLRGHGQPFDLPRRLDGFRLRTARAVGPGRLRASTMDARRRHLELYNLDDDWSQVNDLAGQCRRSSPR